MEKSSMFDGGSAVDSETNAGDIAVNDSSSENQPRPLTEWADTFRGCLKPSIRTGRSRLCVPRLIQKLSSLRRVDPLAKQSVFVVLVVCEMNAWSLLSSMMSASVFGVASLSVSVAV